MERVVAVWNRRRRFVWARTKTSNAPSAGCAQVDGLCSSNSTDRTSTLSHSMFNFSNRKLDQFDLCKHSAQSARRAKFSNCKSTNRIRKRFAITSIDSVAFTRIVGRWRIERINWKWIGDIVNCRFDWPGHFRPLAQHLQSERLERLEFVFWWLWFDQLCQSYPNTVDLSSRVPSCSTCPTTSLRSRMSSEWSQRPGSGQTTTQSSTNSTSTSNRLDSHYQSQNVWFN